MWLISTIISPFIYSWSLIKAQVGSFLAMSEMIINWMWETIFAAVDDALYYTMNCVMVVLYLQDLINDIYTDVEYKIHIVRSGYSNGFLSNIN